MAGERLLALAVPDVPQLGGRVARAGDEGATVRRQRQRHHVAGVAHEGGGLLAGFDVPQAARHVAGAGHDLCGSGWQMVEFERFDVNDVNRNVSVRPNWLRG